MPVAPDATIEISAFSWVPDFAKGLVRDLRVRWALEEAGLAYREKLLDAKSGRSESRTIDPCRRATFTDAGIVTSTIPA